MRRTKLGFGALLAAVFVYSPCATLAPTPPVAATRAPPGTNSANVKVAYSTGIVTKIDLKIGSVELNHKDIPGIMPAMVMEFYVKDRRMLKGLKVGDRVSFALESGHEQIIEIKKQ